MTPPSQPQKTNNTYTPIPTAVITCAVLEDEIAHFAADLDHIIHVEIIEQGLHDEPDDLRAKLQSAVTHIEQTSSAKAIALGYGLCSRGTEGITTQRCLLVIPRAHDCITILLGSKERYDDYVAKYPGTYWYSPGWNRHGSPPGKERHDHIYNEYFTKFGPDNAQYLMETVEHWYNTYNRATYVDLGVGVTENDLQYTRQCANWLKWQFDRQHGDPDLLKSLLNGNWDDERFLILQPGQTIRLTADNRIMEAIPITDTTTNTTNNTTIEKINNETKHTT